MELKSESGTVLTEDLINSWADDAEAGFPGYRFTPVDAQTFRVATPPRRARSIRVEDSLWQKTTARAKADNTNASEVVRRALVSYLTA